MLRGDRLAITSAGTATEINWALFPVPGSHPCPCPTTLLTELLGRGAEQAGDTIQLKCASPTPFLGYFLVTLVPCSVRCLIPGRAGIQKGWRWEVSAERLNCCFWWQFQALHRRQILYKYMQKRTWQDFQGVARQCKGERRELRWLQDDPCRKKPLCVWCECGSKWTACAEAPQRLLDNLKQQSLLQNQKPTSLNCSLVVSSLRKKDLGKGSTWQINQELHVKQCDTDFLMFTKSPGFSVLCQGMGSSINNLPAQFFLQTKNLVSGFCLLLQVNNSLG